MMQTSQHYRNSIWVLRLPFSPSSYSSREKCDWSTRFARKKLEATVSNGDTIYCLMCHGPTSTPTDWLFP